MLFFQTLFAGAAFIAATAALAINERPQTVESGKTYTITYSPVSDIPTTFILRQGANEDLKNVAVLTTTATGGKFVWTVSEDFPNAKDYALQIKQGDDVNYVGPLALTGSDATSSTVPSSSSTVAKSTSLATTASPSATDVTMSTTASGSVSSSAASNGTITTATLTSSTRPTGSGSPTTAGGPPQQSTNAASVLGSSPLALIFGAVAVAYLN